MYTGTNIAQYSVANIDCSYNDDTAVDETIAQKNLADLSLLERFLTIKHWTLERNCSLGKGGKVVFRKSSESPIDCHSLDTEVICENSDWQVVVITTIKQPAFCTLLLPKQPWHSMSTLGDDEIASLANIISIISTRYDNLMMTYVDLTIDWYSTDDTPDTLHAIISPAPSTVDGMFGSQRFIVGDFTPEQTARRLRNLSDIHFRDIFSR